MLATFQGLFGNLRAGARVALFMRVSRQDFRVDAAQLLLWFVVSALIDNAGDWVRQGPGSTLDWAALGAELASFALLVAMAALLAWAFSDASLVVALPVLVLASLPIVQVANVGSQLVGGRDDVPAWAVETLYYVVLMWFLGVLWRSAYVALQPDPRRFVRSIAGGLLLAVPLFVPAGVLPEASWWRQATDSGALDASNPASEPVLALQRALQEEALGAIDEHRQGEADLYFVAFAPDGAGARWRPHVTRARKVMDDHWGTQRRSLAYVNDPALLTETPVATVTHLREALEEIASVIDTDEDIVMMYLAGRSNADGSLHVSLPPLGLVQLTGLGLAHLFRQAGIRWRVVVVSCAAQPFVDALADDHTLVIAGSGSSGRSCAAADEPALGDALFGERLATATSLTSAFDTAQRALAQRGPAPLMHVGGEIAAHLARIRGAGSGRAQSGTGS